MNCFEIRFPLLSPLHAGLVRIGFVQKTRYYLPARTLWGALTAAITRKQYAAGGAKFEKYSEVGKCIATNYLFTHFFVTTKDYGYHLPFNGQCGSEKVAEFERTFIGSFAGTAIGPRNLGAEEGTLHETEVIRHKIEINGKIKEVALGGYVFTSESRENVERDFIGLGSLQVGGKRKYGCGLLGEIKKSDITEVDEGKQLFGSSDYIFEGEHLVCKSGSPVPVHVPLCPESEKFSGDIEPLTWMAYKEHQGPGQQVTNAAAEKDAGKTDKINTTPKLFWTPGSYADCKLNLKPGSYGVFEPD